MNLSIAGRLALVTGGASGIGRAIARRMAKAGADVLIGDIDEPAGVATVEAIRADGGSATFVSLDVASTADVQRLVSHLTDTENQLDILVNNAGIVPKVSFLELEPSTWSRTLDVNLSGAYRLGRALLPQLQSSPAGRIINISSGSAITGSGGGAHYAASKAALDALTRALARECAGAGVTVNGIAPRTIAGPVLATLYSQAELAALTEAIPLRRMGQPEDVANLAVFLASEQAGYIHGQTIVVDGGRTPMEIWNG
ncbi:MAG: 3-oxoacyl-[acyl-carrier-protein] reductase FabG [Anaerolineales bacterium]|nr:3-oxoacyl-[acyl-carrier-protein] reductase FabG [Anaerolineales bacterium]